MTSSSRAAQHSPLGRRNWWDEMINTREDLNCDNGVNDTNNINLI